MVFFSWIYPCRLNERHAIETEGDTMNVKAYLAEYMSRIRAFGQTVRMHSAELISITAIALIGSFLAGAALQEQADNGSQLQRLKASGPEHVELNNWTAEFFNCPNQTMDQTCRRVFRKDKEGNRYLSYFFQPKT